MSIPYVFVHGNNRYMQQCNQAYVVIRHAIATQYIMQYVVIRNNTTYHAICDDKQFLEGSRRHSTTRSGHMVRSTSSRAPWTTICVLVFVSTGVTHLEYRFSSIHAFISGLAVSSQIVKQHPKQHRLLGTIGLPPAPPARPARQLWSFTLPM